MRHYHVSRVHVRTVLDENLRHLAEAALGGPVERRAERRVEVVDVVAAVEEHLLDDAHVVALHCLEELLRVLPQVGLRLEQPLAYYLGGVS